MTVSPSAHLSVGTKNKVEKYFDQIITAKNLAI